MSISKNIENFRDQLPADVTLVAVSKTKSPSDIMEAYSTGHRIFGENKIQEMEGKWKDLPNDIEWHMIGHVQTNKVKYMAPFVSLIHAVDSLKLLKEINKQAEKFDRTIKCLLQIKIADEDSKYGMNIEDAKQLMTSEEMENFQNIKVIGLMGMATFTENTEKIKEEFQKLKKHYDTLKDTYGFEVLSMGMSGDYKLAIENGSTMIRVGSKIFGERNYNN